MGGAGHYMRLPKAWNDACIPVEMDEVEGRSWPPDGVDAWIDACTVVEKVEQEGFGQLLDVIDAWTVVQMHDTAVRGVVHGKEEPLHVLSKGHS